MENNTQTYIELTNIFLQAGLFFMSLLYSLTIVPFYYRSYLKIPIDRKEQSQTAKKNFVIQRNSGIVLMIISVIWWFQNKPLYLFKGEIDWGYHVEDLTSID